MSTEPPPSEGSYLEELHELTIGGTSVALLSKEEQAKLETLHGEIANATDQETLGKTQYRITNLLEHPETSSLMSRLLVKLVDELIQKKSTLSVSNSSVSASGPKKLGTVQLDTSFLPQSSGDAPKRNFTIDKEKKTRKWAVDMKQERVVLSPEKFVDNMRRNFEMPVSKEASVKARQQTKECSGVVPLEQTTIDLLRDERQKGSRTMIGGIDPEKAKIAREGWAKADQMVREWATSNDVAKLSPKQLLKMLTEINRLLTGSLNPEDSENPGKSGKIREEDRGGELLPASEIVKELDEYCRWLTDMVGQMVLEPGEIDPIELAAQAYQRLNSIHPFGDGNGRVCQMMMDFVLQAGKLLPATLSGVLISPIPPEETPSEGTSKMTTQALEAVTQGVKSSYALLQKAQLTPQGGPSDQPREPEKMVGTSSTGSGSSSDQQDDRREEIEQEERQRRQAQRELVARATGRLHAAIQQTEGDRQKLILLLSKLTPEQLEELRESFQTDIDLVLGYPGRVDEDIQRQVLDLIDEFKAIQGERDNITASSGGGGWGEPDPDSSSGWGRNHPLGQGFRDVR